VASIHSLEHKETFHPVVGPVAEAEALYVRQLRLPERIRACSGEFVLWDVGLGAAANVLTVLRASREIPGKLRIVSFDHTLAPLQFGLQHASELGYLGGFEESLQQLLHAHHLQLPNGQQDLEWELRLGDFPQYINAPAADKLPKPHAILFDAFSPATNPAMWTQPLFARMFSLLDPKRPCALPTYSRSTMLRVSLLLAGFYVGVGHATGEKEQTTIAANSMTLIAEPLDSKWLQRAHRSTSAEPLWMPHYRQSKMSPETWEKLQRHPQFKAL
jgi:tRNA U34 5-methylaminomethyl-2-thiouridine-forming methyltransferase MnmC